MELTKEQEQYVQENCSTVDLDEMYDDMLDDCYGDVEVCGLIFSSCQVLKEVDPTAYRCGKVDYEDSLGLVEIDGEYYIPDDVEDALQDFADLQDEDEDEKNGQE